MGDFKTTSRNGGPLEIAHEIQLSCYAYLLRHGSPVREAGLEIRNLVKTKVPQVSARWMWKSHQAAINFEFAKAGQMSQGKFHCLSQRNH